MNSRREIRPIQFGASDQPGEMYDFGDGRYIATASHNNNVCVEWSSKLDVAPFLSVVRDHNSSPADGIVEVTAESKEGGIYRTKGRLDEFDGKLVEKVPTVPMFARIATDGILIIWRNRAARLVNSDVESTEIQFTSVPNLVYGSVPLIRTSMFGGITEEELSKIFVPLADGQRTRLNTK
jgi:hypothetical protein